MTYYEEKLVEPLDARYGAGSITRAALPPEAALITKLAMITEHATSIDTALGDAIRAARWSRGLTQRDLALHLGVTRATIASYETGRRKLLAETLIHIARLCDKPLGFFDPTMHPSLPEATRIRADESLSTSAEQPAVQALIAALELRPDALPVMMNVLEDWLRDQQAHRT